jgi:SWI/SNF-related matrix-associated actin-dependent regulator 1 of chromatin subfamily A
MKKELRPFQITGSQFLQEHYHALLGDEMGLGKTITALDALDRLGLKRALVVCPASVRSNWHQEAAECGTLCNLSVISYNGAVAGMGKGYYDAIVLDECHLLKTPDSQRTLAIFRNESGLARHAKYKWCLSGTPVLNRPRELYPVLKCLHPKLSPYDTWERFTQRYCGAYFDGYSINTKGASHIDELKGKLEGFMLRRTKAEVLKELPPRIISHPPIDLNDAEMRPIMEMERDMGDREAFLSKTHEDYAQLGDLARLLRVTGLSKAPKTAAFVEDLLETVDKVVVFTKHRDVAALLFEHLKKYKPVIYQGGMNDLQKSTAINSFVGGSGGEDRDREGTGHRVFIGNMVAAGTGINGLQKVCSNIVFAELSWVPGEMSQAIDRCHRIGQSSSSVNVYILHAPGTLESAMLQVHAGKQAVIDRLMGVEA